jgi:hypothetical protein
MNDPAMMDTTAITVGEAATDAAEVASYLASRRTAGVPGGLPMTDFDRERTARILDRLSEELAQAASDIRRGEGGQQ